MRIPLALGPFMPVPPVLGGAVEKVHLLLAGVYRAAGHEVTIVSRRYKDFAHEEIVDGIRHIRVASFDRSSSLPANLLRDFRYALHVARALPQSDITATNSFASTLPCDWTLAILGPPAIAQGGDGIASLDESKALAAPVGPRCQFVGPVFDQEALIREDRRGTIFVYPSLAEKGESFGLAPLEA